ncbi:hypothetical protein B296_00020268, partial [Ensete ventricosum]
LYNRRVYPQLIRAGNLVLRKAEVRPDLVPWKAGTELGRTVPSHGCCPRKDLHVGNYRKTGITENMAHFKPSKILHLTWK